MVDYLKTHGVDPDEVGRISIAIEVFDVTTVFFGFLVFVAAGIVPVVALLVRADSARSTFAQVVWAATIVGLVLIAKVFGY